LNCWKGPEKGKEKAEGLSPSIEEKVNLLKRILNENIEEKDGQVQKRKSKDHL